MRKMMTKEVTTTKVKVAKMEMVDGMPKAIELPVVELLGNLSLEQAQKAIVKKHGAGVTVFETISDTIVYEMPVEEFIQHASVKVMVEKIEEKEVALA